MKEMEIPEKLAEQNQRTWEFMVEFYSHAMKNPRNERFTAPLLEVVLKISQSPYAKYFRSGQSLYDLIISTTPYHGLREGDMFMRVTQQGRDDDLYSVEYYGPNHVRDFDECEGKELLNLIEPLLGKLWHDVHGVELPKYRL